MTEKKERPFGISTLAVLFVIGTLAGLATFTYQLYQIQQATGINGIGSVWYIADTLRLFAWAMAAAFGLWLGKGWGWWLSALLLLHSIFSSISGVVSIWTTAGSLVLESPELSILSLKMIGRSIVSALFLGYFFRRHVLAYFGLDTSGRPIRVIIVLAVTLIIYLGYYGCMFLLAKFA